LIPDVEGNERLRVLKKRELRSVFGLERSLISFYLSPTVTMFGTVSYPLGQQWIVNLWGRNGVGVWTVQILFDG
jgi:hypothetical protein